MLGSLPVMRARLLALAQAWLAGCVFMVFSPLVVTGIVLLLNTGLVVGYYS